MKTSGNPTVLGSESCYSTEHVRTNCYDQFDYTITKFELQNGDTLVIYQNPRNVLKAKIPQLEGFKLDIDALNKNKVENTFVIDTTDGLGGGGELSGTKITLTLKANNEHVHLDRNGFYIEEFTEVTTSGTVPSPKTQDEEHYLTSKGTWVTLSQMKYMGEINLSTGFPNPDNLSQGMMYNIADLGDPSKTIVNPYDDKTYKSEDVLLWTGSKWVVIGTTSVKVNLDIQTSRTTNVISNSAGKGVTIQSATSQAAGLLSADSKDAISKFSGIKTIDGLVQNQGGLSLNYTERVLESQSEAPKNIIIPLATDTTNGLLSSTDKIRLTSLPNKTSNSSLNHDGSTLILENTTVDLDSGSISIDKIPFPIASYQDKNYKDGVISGENMEKLDGITGMITLVGYEHNLEDLRITYQKYNANSGDLISDYFTLPTATVTRNGLLSKDDKIKLDSLSVMVQKQSDYDITDPEDVAYIKNAPQVLTSVGVKRALVPSTLGLATKANKILNANGEWVDVTLAKPIMTVSDTEPTDPNLRVDGAIWIKPYNAPGR